MVIRTPFLFRLLLAPAAFCGGGLLVCVVNCTVDLIAINRAGTAVAVESQD
jgi:hypothetical protein